MRAYVFHFTGKDGSKCSVTIDLLNRPFGYSREQATMEAITSVIAAKGEWWTKDYSTQEVK